MDNCSDGICELLDERRLSLATDELRNCSLESLEEVLSDTARPRVWRAAALRLLCVRSAENKVLYYFRIAFKADDLELRHFSFITLKFWLVDREPLNNSKETELTIQAAMLSNGTELEFWSRQIRALLADPSLFAECVTMYASGKLNPALKLLVLMRSEAAYKKIKELFSTNVPLKTKVNLALALASNGDPSVQKFLREFTNDQQALGVVEESYMWAIIALTRLCDQIASNRLLDLVKTGALSDGDGYVNYMLRGFGREYPDVIIRITEWIKNLNARKS